MSINSVINLLHPFLATIQDGRITAHSMYPGLQGGTNGCNPERLMLLNQPPSGHIQMGDRLSLSQTDWLCSELLQESSFAL